MSANQSGQSGTNHATEEALPCNGSIKNRHHEEPELINLFRDITQENESEARNVLMFVLPDDLEAQDPSPNPPA